MPHWCGEVGACWWDYFQGEMRDSDWSGYIAHLERFSRSGLTGVFLNVAYNSNPPSAAHRRRLAETAAQHPDTPKRVMAGAHAMNSTMARGALTAINWVFRKPYPERVVATPTEALDWLGQQTPDLDLAAIRKAIKDTVPPQAYWDA
jgi:hypothetical protein